jgi:hypothetical protein
MTTTVTIKCDDGVSRDFMHDEETNSLYDSEETRQRILQVRESSAVPVILSDCHPLGDVMGDPAVLRLLQGILDYDKVVTTTIEGIDDDSEDDSEDLYEWGIRTGIHLISAPMPSNKERFNAIITKEMKASVKELGVSKDELYEYFYGTNAI